MPTAQVPDEPLVIPSDGSISSTNCDEVGANVRLIPLSIPAKNGSENTRVSGSGTTIATESVRRVTSARAARFGTYPNCRIACSTAATVSGNTFGEPFTTRETVARDTPATAATCSSVGEPDPSIGPPRLSIGLRSHGSTS